MKIVSELSTLELANNLVRNISIEGLSIYDEIEVGDPNLWIPSKELELLLNEKLVGLNLGNLSIKTRSKAVKTLICEALGYQVPPSFKRVRPRFPGLNFDVATQKANNFQPWNESISPTRRYVLVRPNAENIIQKVKVVSGDMLAVLDKTGKLTTKYQAQLNKTEHAKELISSKDTSVLKPLVKEEVYIPANINPTAYPSPEYLLSIQSLYKKLETLVGKSFKTGSKDQERNRGAALHALVCEAVGYSSYKDDGRFPDVKNQLLEVKLQTSSTIDLGLFNPNEKKPLDIPQIDETKIRICDVRYALFYGVINDDILEITNFYLTTGEDFFTRFRQFQGKVQNSKLQVWLRKDFFE